MWQKLELTERRLMIPLRRIYLYAFIVVAYCVPSLADTPDEKAIRDVFTAFSISWNQPGMPGFGDLFTGEQRLETPSGPHRAKAGEGMFAPAGVPMQLNITGTEKREALFAIVHDASQPATTVSEWQPKGLCQ
jgi:hypothetical protein